ncbi:unnamed protein product [Calicophoron daubneyi]|uniref:Kinesin motor domain-containing protein n=1 Tax=Calicophoron daubneyi TaxID=300641 RepID=A0AAV2TDC5_CALDB
MASETRAFVRIRPCAKEDRKVVSVAGDQTTLRIEKPKDIKQGLVNNQVTSWEFKVDRVFTNSSQEQVYQDVASGLIKNGLGGVNGMLMCYGQTGAGKTYTLTGVSQLYPDRGIVPRALAHLFGEVEKMSEHSIPVRLSYVEIYNEQLIDLLNPAYRKGSPAPEPLVITESERDVFVKGLCRPVVKNLDEALSVLFEGELNRTVAAHALNRISSRAHAIFTIHLAVQQLADSSGCTKLSKLNYVDLAGSERVRKTQPDGNMFKEANYINRSLTFLEQTVLALSDPNREHVPYRQSKLTHYLKHSFGGRCQTILVANVWDEPQFTEETVSTLRFAVRVMKLPCRPAANQQFDLMATVKQLQKENASLKRELLMYDTLNNRGVVNYEFLTEQQKQLIRQQVVQYVDGDIKDLEIVNLRQLQEIFESFKTINIALRNQVADLRTELSKQTADTLSVANTTTSSSGLSVSRSIGRAGGAASSKRSQGRGSIVPDVSQEKPTVPILVGDLDPAGGHGFVVQDKAATGKSGGISLATDSAFLQAKRSERRKSTVAQNKPPVLEVTQASIPILSSEQAPRSKIEAFEDFKTEAGKELFKVFEDNKALLRQKRNEGLELADNVNRTKTALEDLHNKVKLLKSEREAQGLMFTTEGEPIVTEEEFNLLRMIHQLRGEYHQYFEQWRKQKEIVQYCKHMVDMSRARLIQEFESWYQICFADQSNITALKEATELPLSEKLVQKLEEKELLDRTLEKDSLVEFQVSRQMAFMQDPEAGVYEQAREGVIHKHTFAEGYKRREKNQNFPPAVPLPGKAK